MQTEVTIDNCPYCAHKCRVMLTNFGEIALESWYVECEIALESWYVECESAACAYNGTFKDGTPEEAITAHNTLCRSVRSSAEYQEILSRMLHDSNYPFMVKAREALLKYGAPIDDEKIAENNAGPTLLEENAVLREQVAKLEKEAVKQSIEIKNLWNTLPTIQTVFAGDSTYCCCGLDCGGSSCMCSICGDGPGCHTDDCPWSAETEEEAGRRWELPKYMAIRLSRAEAYSEYAADEIERLEQITNNQEATK